MEGIGESPRSKQTPERNPNYDVLARWPELKEQLDAWFDTGPNQRSVETTPDSLSMFADYIALDRERVMAVKAYLDALPPALQSRAADVQKHLWWQVTKILSKG